jgi:hypothetical protein
MSEPDAGGLSRLDADRAHSMEHEGGSSAAMVERCDEESFPWKAAATGVACLVGIAAGLGLARLWRSR